MTCKIGKQRVFSNILSSWAHCNDVVLLEEEEEGVEEAIEALAACPLDFPM